MLGLAPVVFVPLVLAAMALVAVVARSPVVATAAKSAHVARGPLLDTVTAKAASPSLPTLMANATPVYVKSEGPKFFYVGACLEQWTDALRVRCQRDTGTNCGAKAIEAIKTVLAIYGAGATEVADWLEQRLCLRMKAKLRRYRIDGVIFWRIHALREGEVSITQWDGQQGDVVRNMVGMLRELSPMYLPKRKGYKRAWLLEDWPSGSRNDSALTLVWADDEPAGKAIVQELVPEPELRRMLLLIAGSGAFLRGDLDRMDEGRTHRWRPATRAQVKDEWPGVGDD